MVKYYKILYWGVVIMIKDKVGLSKSIACYLRHRKSIVNDRGWANIRDLYLIVRGSNSFISYKDFMEDW